MIKRWEISRKLLLFKDAVSSSELTINGIGKIASHNNISLRVVGTRVAQGHMPHQYLENI